MLRLLIRYLGNFYQITAVMKAVSFFIHHVFFLPRAAWLTKASLLCDKTNLPKYFGFIFFVYLVVRVVLLLQICNMYKQNLFAQLG